jgi:type III pantothenate kinase
MLLTIDVGNTQITAGLFQKSELKAQWRLSSTRERTEDESWVLMDSICKTQGYDLRDASGVVISSVVPDMTSTFHKLSDKYLQIEPLVISHDLDIGLRIVYDPPASVGADRLCNAVGAYELFGGPVVVVDFGTATTFDVISEDKEYLGGIIVPGLEMSSSILFHRAARLPRVALQFPEHIIGRSTETSMQSGLLYGTVEMVDGMVRRIRSELGESVRTIATGGLARLIVEQLNTIDNIEPYLTLEGMRSIYRRCGK